MKKSQLNAISYAYTEKKKKEAKRLREELKKNGLDLRIISPYPQVNIRRINKLLKGEN